MLLATTTVRRQEDNPTAFLTASKRAGVGTIPPRAVLVLALRITLVLRRMRAAVVGA